LTEDRQKLCRAAEHTVRGGGRMNHLVPGRHGSQYLPSNISTSDKVSSMSLLPGTYQVGWVHVQGGAPRGGAGLGFEEAAVSEHVKTFFLRPPPNKQPTQYALGPIQGSDLSGLLRMPITDDGPCHTVLGLAYSIGV